MKYNNELTDDEMLMLIHEGDKELVEVLINKYKDMARLRAQSMYILGAEPEDLMQEGMIGLFKAVQDYDLGRDASFATFAQLCVNRQIFKAVQASNRLKHIPLNSYISLYGSDSDSADNNGELIANVPSKQYINPEDMFIDKETVESIEKKIEESLSDLEKQVLELSMTGMGYVEVAKVLGKDEKSTDNALQRARSKVKKIIF